MGVRGVITVVITFDWESKKARKKPAEKNKFKFHVFNAAKQWEQISIKLYVNV